MNWENKKVQYTVDIELVLDRLSEVLNLMDTVYFGLKKEKTEKQVLDCFMCIRHNVQEIYTLAEKTIHSVKNSEETSEVLQVKHDR